jgi:hypothetical protein
MEQCVETRVFWHKVLHDVHHVGPLSRLPGLPVRYDDGAYKVAMPNQEEFALRPGKLAIVRLEELTYTLRIVNAPQKIEAPLVVDFEFLNIIVIVFFLMLTAITALHLYPSEVETFDELALTENVKFAPLLERPREVPKEEIKVAATATSTPSKKNGGGSKTQKDPGLLGMLKKGAVKELLEGGMLGGEVVAALEQVSQAPTASNDGINVRNPGGFDHPGLEKIRAPGIDTRGREPGFGDDKAKLSRRVDTEIVLADEKPIAVGSLPPELIAQVIKDNRNGFRYCYERNLQVEKDLAGMVKLFFIIGPTGKVTSASVKEATLKNAAVQECMLTRMRSLVFPVPRGGGVVIVTYPFVFTSN